MEKYAPYNLPDSESCPKCGSEETMVEDYDATNKYYFCHDCGYRWSTTDYRANMEDWRGE